MRMLLVAVAFVVAGCGLSRPAITTGPSPDTTTPAPSAAPVGTATPTRSPSLSPAPLSDGRDQFFAHTDKALDEYSERLDTLVSILEGSDSEAQIGALIDLQTFALTEQTWARKTAPDACLKDAQAVYLRLFENVEKTFDSYAKYLVLRSTADRDAAVAGSKLNAELINGFNASKAEAQSASSCQGG